MFLLVVAASDVERIEGALCHTLFEGKPGAISHGKRVPRVVLPRVPVALVVPRPVQVVPLVHWVPHVVHLVESVVVRAQLPIEFFETFLAVKVPPR